MFKRVGVLVLVAVMTCVPVLSRETTIAQEDVPEPPPVVNVEIILDSSGSMANLTDTGETRMDAAKRVLRDVVMSLPEREGAVNVGFRVYGQEGDNTDATKPLSCNSSELQVPVDGVDQQALLGAIDNAQPTGWTPIARSLSRAGKDFPEASETSINAVVLVTDGTETCDGDPPKVARDLNRKDGVELITHVIGFGTTPDDQLILSGIAENGKGLLLGAANASELRNALFSVLEDLQIVVGAGYVGGNGFGLLPEGDAGALSVVGVGPLDVNFPNLAFVVRNNTGEDVVGIKANVTARDSAGTLLGSADAQIGPFYVRAGGLALGSAQFSQGTILPPDATFEFDLQQTPVSEARYSIFSDLNIVEASLFDNRIVGTAQNGFTEPVDGGLQIRVVCLDEAGTVTGFQNGYSDGGALPPDDTQSFEVDLFSLTYLGYTCPVFLVSAQGYGPVQLPPQLMPEVRTASGRTPTPASDDDVQDDMQAEEDDETSTSPTAASPVSEPVKDDDAACSPAETAEDVVLAFAEMGLSVGEYAVYDAATDPNTLLGRPGQYVSKVNFEDTSVEQDTTALPFSIVNGGTVEIFSDEADAEIWQESVEAIARSGIAQDVQYVYREDLIVIRLSRVLLPDEAEAYGDALRTVSECD